MSAGRKLHQLPLVVVNGELRAALEALGARLRAIASDLERRAAGDGRSWLEVLYAHARAEGVTLEEALGGDLRRAAAAARRAAWWEIRARIGASQGELAAAFRMHSSTVSAGLARRDAEVEQLLAVSAYQAEAADDVPGGELGAVAVAGDGEADDIEQLALDWDREHPQLPVAAPVQDRAAEDAEIVAAQQKLLRKREREGLPADGGRAA